MKHYTTRKQLQELMKLGYTGGDRVTDFIEFLGKDLKMIDNLYQYEIWKVVCVFIIEVNSNKSKITDKRFEEKELVSALLKAVKYKLKI